MKALFPSGASPVIIIAAHPDDEVLGAGALLSYLKGVHFLHITDGAPGNMRAAKARGFATREEYAAARRGELAQALKLIPGSAGSSCGLRVPDLEAAYNIPYIVTGLASVFKTLGPAAALTHPYEGGHPDHDSAAFAAAAAARLVEREGMSPPRIIEFTSYHGPRGKLIPSTFLPADSPEVCVRLKEDERLLKSRMVGSFATQKKALSAFPVEVEKFRAAPDYDFSRAPHRGRLFYEHFDWGISGAKWRMLAREAAKALDIEEAFFDSNKSVSRDPGPMGLLREAVGKLLG